MIFQELHELSDRLALAMSSQMLYSAGFKIVQESLADAAAFCLGHRIVCLGDNVETEDLPPGFTEKDKEELRVWGESWEWYPSYYSYACEEFGEVLPILSPYAWIKAWGPVDRYQYLWNYRVSIAEQEALGRMLELESPPLSPEWALCNLTKREYVKAKDVMHAMRVSFSDHNTAYHALGAVLMCRICWSSDAGFVDLWYGEGINRGVWAADRFEVTTLDRIADLKPVQGGKEGEWTDVSDEAVEELKERLECERSWNS